MLRRGRDAVVHGRAAASLVFRSLVFALDIRELIWYSSTYYDIEHPTELPSLTTGGGTSKEN